MGEVWLAEQKEPVRRRVALKLVKAGMESREVIARFESEGQALALMNHSAIAKVLDAGSTPQGAPYFVMEYVAGSPSKLSRFHLRLLDLFEEGVGLRDLDRVLRRLGRGLRQMLLPMPVHCRLRRSETLSQRCGALRFGAELH